MNYKQHAIVFWIVVVIVILITAAYNMSAQELAQPAAPAQEVIDDYFGQKITDPYRWMETPKSEDLSQWMKAQNDYTRAVLDRSPLRGSFLKRIDELTNANVAVTSIKKIGNLYFYLKISPGETDGKLYFRYGIVGTERLLVDPSKITDGGKRFSITDYSPSQDGMYVSYLISAGGGERGEIRVVETATGKDMGERIDRVEGDPGRWLPDGKSFLYVRLAKLSADDAETERYQKTRIFLHNLGDNAGNDRPVFGFGVNPEIEIDPKDLFSASMPAGSKNVFVNVGSDVTGNYETYVAPIEELSKTEIPWRKIVSFDDGVTATVPSGDDLYLLTYKNAPRFKVIKTSLRNPDLKNAKTIIPEGAAILTNMAATVEALIVQQNDGGISRLSSVDLKSGKIEDMKLPFNGTIKSIVSDSREKELLFTTESWVRSSTIFSYDSKKRKLTDTRLQPPSPINTSDYEAVEVKAKAADGTMIPLSIIYKKGIKLDGKNPTVLSGYGSYGISQNPFFLPAFFAWMERGGIVAFAHVRGGGEYGREWHQGGFQKTKPNTWRDFIACAEYLIDRKYTSPELLSAHGASAGGILVGNAIAERPDLFGAAIIQVGVTNTLRIETTANGVPNIPEFGSVKTEDGFRNLLAMDAYQKIKDGVKYPAVMLTHGINDPRVEPWFSAKYAARMQAASSSGKPVLLRIDYDAGHGFGSSRKQRNEESADIMAFLSEQISDKALADN